MTAIIRLPISEQSQERQNISINQLAEIVDTAGTLPTTLSANRTYYVRSDGNNSNTGLINSAGGAFLTLTGAMAVIGKLNFSGFTVTVQIGTNATYAGVTIPSWIGGGALTFIGDATTPSNVVVSSAICFNIPSTLTGILNIRGFKLVGSSYGIFAGAVCTINLGNMEYGACGYHNQISSGGVVITFTSNYTISGGATAHINTAFGFITNNGSALTCTLTGTPAFSTSFALAQFGGSIFMGNMIYSGAATGVRYLSQLNGIIHTGGGGPNFFPGNAAGTTNSGGQYI